MEYSFSIIIASLVINIVLLCRIKFGELTITKLSTRPYWISLILLLVQLCESSYLMYMTEVEYKGRYFAFVENVLKPGASLHMAVTISGTTKMMLILFFTLTRAHEYEALVTFVIWQKNHRLESL